MPKTIGNSIFARFHIHCNVFIHDKVTQATKRTKVQVLSVVWSVLSKHLLCCRD